MLTSDLQTTLQKNTLQWHARKVAEWAEEVRATLSEETKLLERFFPHLLETERVEIRCGKQTIAFDKAKDLDLFDAIETVIKALRNSGKKLDSINFFDDSYRIGTKKFIAN